MALVRGAALLLATGLSSASYEVAVGAAAPVVQTTTTPGSLATAPGPFKPVDESVPDVWIFSGVLPDNNETFSGTLVSSKTEAQFEMTLADGATCDGSELKGDIGLVRLSEIPCSDGRSMRALFVPQDGDTLKVFGHVGDERFASSAHLLGSDPIPEKQQTLEPTVPQVRPPVPPGASP